MNNEWIENKEVIESIFPEERQDVIEEVLAKIAKIGEEHEISGLEMSVIAGRMIKWSYKSILLHLGPIILKTIHEENKQYIEDMYKETKDTFKEFSKDMVTEE